MDFCVILKIQVIKNDIQYNCRHHKIIVQLQIELEITLFYKSNVTNKNFIMMYHFYFVMANIFGGASGIMTTIIKMNITTRVQILRYESNYSPSSNE